MDKDSHLKDTIRNQEKELEISGCEELKAAADAYAGEHGWEPVKIYAREAEKDFLLDTKSNLSKDMGRPVTVTADVYLKDGEELNLDGIRIKVLATPGHTAGGVSYYFPEEDEKNNLMRIIGNLLWWLFGGLEAAIGYFTGSLALACTIIGIPFAIQTFKIGLLCLWPFGSTVRESNSPTGCIRIPLNLLWLIFGGLWACIMHLFFGFLLCITIIGIPWGKQHFKMAGLSLAPFGKDVELGF